MNIHNQVVELEIGDELDEVFMNVLTLAIINKKVYQIHWAKISGDISLKIYPEDKLSQIWKNWNNLTNK